MRPLVEEQLRGRKLPLIMAHKGGTAYGRENARATIEKALAFNPDIIEVDVRKSHDGILYCHHGSIPFGVIAASFFGLLTFAQIQKLVGKRDTLKDILAILPPKGVLLYLDLKDPWIGVDDLKPLIKGRKGVWVAPFGSVAWLKRLRTGLGEEYAYAFNRPAIAPRRAAKRLAGEADMIQFWRWGWNKRTIGSIEDSGVACHMIEWLIPREKYLDSMQLSRYHGLFFSMYDLADAAEIERVPII